MKRTAKVVRRSIKRGANKSRRDVRVLGRMPDGVIILRSKAKPTHFTSSQIRKAILEVENTLSD